VRLLTLALVLAAGDAAAQTCVARVNAQELIIVPEAIAAPRAGLRERLSMWPSRTWDRAWGERVACDGATVTAFLARTMQLDQTEGYCLAEGDDAEGWLLVPGSADYRGRCRATACERVNAAAGVAGDVARTVASIATLGRVGSVGEGVEAVAHGTGAMLLTGGPAAVAASLTEAAASVSAAVTAAPVAAGAAAVTVIAVGGGVYLCS
jgi:hypothetical protein